MHNDTQLLMKYNELRMKEGRRIEQANKYFKSKEKNLNLYLDIYCNQYLQNIPGQEKQIFKYNFINVFLYPNTILLETHFAKDNQLYCLAKNHSIQEPQPISTIHLVTMKYIISTFGVPYHNCVEMTELFTIICNLITYYRAKHITSIKKQIKYNSPILGLAYDFSREKEILWMDAILRYYSDLNSKRFPINVPEFLYPQNGYYTENGNLIYNPFDSSEMIYLNKTHITTALKNLDLPTKSDYKIKRLYSCIKALASPSWRIHCNTSEKNCIFSNEALEYYFYRYDPSEKKMVLSLLPENIKHNFNIPINTTIVPQLTKRLKEYLLQITDNNENSLRGLAKLIASAYSESQSLKKIFLLENVENITHNIINLAYMCQIKHSMPATLNILCNSHEYINNLNKFMSNYDIKHNAPYMIYTYDVNIRKYKANKLDALTKLINGSEITCKDPYVSTIRFRNYAPIILSTHTLEDYRFIDKRYACIKIKINNEYIDDFKPTPEEYAWLSQIFIPWGKEILCNSNLDITKKKKPCIETIATNTIDDFLNNFIIEKENSNIYPEALYASYSRFFEAVGPNSQLCSIGAFKKQIQASKRYTYSKYHVRETKEHAGSNRHAFRNIAIDEEALNNFLAGNQPRKKNSFDLSDTLDQITEHYSNLFGKVVSPNINKRIKSKKPPARIVYTSPSDKE